MDEAPDWLHQLPQTSGRGLAARMFSRWCQENFFRYMMQHYAMDLLSEYGTQAIPGTERLVNPAWRELDRQRNSVQNKLRYRQVRFAQITLNTVPEEDEKKHEQWMKKKSTRLEEVEHFENQLNQIKQKIKQTPKHVCLDDLDEQDRFERLATDRKRLMDTIKLIAYRSETAMAQLIKDDVVGLAAARSILQDLYVAHADLLPDARNGQLIVRIHGASRPAVNRKVKQIIESLNEAGVNYPGTDLKLRYEISAYELNKNTDAGRFGATANSSG